MVDKDVDVKKRLQVGLHIAKDEAGIQFAFGKTCRKKYGEQVVAKQPSQVVVEQPSQVVVEQPTQSETAV